MLFHNRIVLQWYATLPPNLHVGATTLMKYITRLPCLGACEKAYRVVTVILER